MYECPIDIKFSLSKCRETFRLLCVLSDHFFPLRFPSFSGPYFLEFGLNTEIYGVNLYI